MGRRPWVIRIAPPLDPGLRRGGAVDLATILSSGCGPQLLCGEGGVDRQVDLVTHDRDIGADAEVRTLDLGSRAEADVQLLRHRVRASTEEGQLPGARFDRSQRRDCRSYRTTADRLFIRAQFVNNSRQEATLVTTAF